MTFRRTLLLGALASCALLVAGADARAAYSYTTGPVTFTAPPAGVTETFTPNADTTPSDVIANASFVTIDYIGLPASPVSGTQTLSFSVVLASTLGPTEVFSITGTLNILSASSAAVAANFTPTAITPTSGSGFSLLFTGYAPDPASAGKTADLGFIITPPGAPGAVIPEPTSMALLGTGLVGVVGLGLRRSRTKAKV